MYYLTAATAIVLIFLTERHVATTAMAIAGFVFFFSLFLILVGDFGQAALLALFLAMAIFLSSYVKHHHSGMKLTLGDLALTFAGTIPFMLKQYRLAASFTLAGFALIIIGILATFLFLDASPASPLFRYGTLIPAIAVTTGVYFGSGGAAYFRPQVTLTPGYLSSFFASTIDFASWWRGKKLHMSDIASDPLELLPAEPARTALKPDILIIQQESLFDPRLYGLPVEPQIGEFFAPSDGKSGRLRVDIFGGGSWQSEFSMLTGLSSASFGPDSYFLFSKGVGRFRHSLPLVLKSKGYQTQLVTSCRRNFLNYDAFYAGIGVDDRVFTDDMAIDLAAFEATSSDSLFLPQVDHAMSAALNRNPAPMLTIALTNYNHGPHDRRLVAEGQFETSREFALSSLNDPHYGEYYARLSETAAAWADLKSRLVARGRPIIVMRYGDHQPTMIRRLERALGLRASDQRQFETFWSLEALNCEFDRPTPTDPLDIAFLGTIAMDAAGIGLDEVSATRKSLMTETGTSYFASNSLRKRQFHRRLVNMGLIEG